MNSIFTMTVMLVRDGRIVSHRTWGYEFDFAKAEHTITHPDAMFFGGYRNSDQRYTHAVIEEYEPGYYGSSKMSWWYAASHFHDDIPQKVELCSPPTGLEDVVSFAMG